MLPLAVTGEAIPGGGWRGTAPGPVITRIDPDPSRLGLAGAGGQHLHRRVIGEDRLGRQDMASDDVSQRFQKGGDLADPIGQRGTVEIEPLAVEDLALAIQGKMISVFADQHMGQETGPRVAPLDGARGQRGLDEAFTAGTGQARADNPVHDEASGDVFQLFGDILADPAQAPAAIGTGVGPGGQLHLHPRDVIRDRAALRFVRLLDVRQPHPRGHRGGGKLAGLQGQLQLLGGLGRRAKPVCAVPGQLVPELLDQDRLCLHLGQ